MAWGVLPPRGDTWRYLILRFPGSRGTNMQAMGATTIDVAREFQGHLAKLPPIVVAAFIQNLPRAGVLSFVTLVDADDAGAERELASMEMDLEAAFQEHAMEFSTIHLRGRSPSEFIPKDAFVIYRRRERSGVGAQ